MVYLGQMEGKEIRLESKEIGLESKEIGLESKKIGLEGKEIELEGMLMVRKAGVEDAKVVAALALCMWEADSEEMEEDFREILASREAAVFLKIEEEEAVGFAQCQLRHDYVEGTDTSPVGYLEGIFIKEGYRRRGYAKELLGECEKWAYGQGCTEFASDCEMDNEDSFRFHMQMGFAEANRVICFTKKLSLEKTGKE